MATQEAPKPDPNTYWVVPGKLLAGEYPGARDPEEARSRLRRFLQAGVRHFIDLTEAGELEPYGELLTKEADSRTSYQRIPIRDVSVPEEPKTMAEIVAAIDRAMAEGGITYVHCWGGVGRTGLAVACWLQERGMTPAEALTDLADKWRSCAKSIRKPDSPGVPLSDRRSTPTGTQDSFLVALFVLDASGQSPAASSTPLNLEQRVIDIEKRIQAIEEIPGVAMALKLAGSAHANTAAEPTPTPQSDSPLELVSWKYQFLVGQYQYQYEHLFTYVLKNRSDKPIKLVDGTLLFTDLLGEKLIAIQITRDVKYPAGGSTPTSGSWPVNQFEPGEARINKLKHDDIKATLVIRKVVFDDNSVWRDRKPE